MQALYLSLWDLFSEHQRPILTKALPPGVDFNLKSLLWLVLMQLLWEQSNNLWKLPISLRKDLESLETLYAWFKQQTGSNLDHNYHVWQPFHGQTHNHQCVPCIQTGCRCSQCNSPSSSSSFGVSDLGFIGYHQLEFDMIHFVHPSPIGSRQSTVQCCKV